MAGSLLVLGGARSGKSLFAENLVLKSGLEPVYIATGFAGDGEMSTRVQEHQARRGPEWQTIEEPVDLARIIRDHSSPQKALLVDCLTFWVFNVMDRDEDQLEVKTEGLIEALSGASGPVVFVSNEVGLSIVPENALARRFRDNQGRVNRLIADACDRVIFVAAGQPIILKPQSHSEIKL